MTGTVSPAAVIAPALDVVGRRLLGALYREDIGDARTAARWNGDRVWLAGRWRTATRHAGDRIEVRETVAEPPGDLLSAAGLDSARLAAELNDAVTNLAFAYQQRAGIDAELRATGAPDLYAWAAGQPNADDQAWSYERLATEGHNLHPCGRTRLGWDLDDLRRYDQEAPGLAVGFLAVRADRHRGDDVGAVLRDWYAGVPVPPPGYLTQPVHPWQATLVARRYPELFRAGDLRALPGQLDAVPTTALRTVLLGPDADGYRRYLKLSLDIQVTSTRRSISIASTRNGPLLSSWLNRLVEGDPALRDVLLLAEVAGAAMQADDPDPTASRDLAAIVRSGLSGRTRPDEVAVPAAALPARSPLTGRTVLAELVDRHATGHPGPDPALDFLDRYARLLLPPVLHLVTRYGIGLEAHLQNCLPLFVDGTPHRIGLRDLAGLRLHLPRFRRYAGPDFALWPGSVIGTDDEQVVLAKVAYTAFQAHLGELVIRLADSHDLDETLAWQHIRRIIDEVYADPARGQHAAADHATLTAPRLPHKALLRMRWSDGGGDIYLPVRNPLHG